MSCRQVARLFFPEHHEARHRHPQCTAMPSSEAARRLAAGVSKAGTSPLSTMTKELAASALSAMKIKVVAPTGT